MGERTSEMNWRVEPADGAADTRVVSIARPESPARPSDDDSPEAIRTEMAHTRAEMAGTIDAIQSKLNPESLMDQARDHAIDVLDHAKEQATDAAAQARDAIRAATIGRVEKMMSNASDSARGAGNSLMGTIRANPIPAALAAVGLGWLWMSRRGGDSSARHYQGYGHGDNRYGSGSSDLWTRQSAAGAGYTGPGASSHRMTGSPGTSEGIGNRIGETAEGLQSRIGETADQVRNTFEEKTEQIQTRVGETAEQVGEFAGQIAAGTQERWEQFGEQAQHTAGQAQDQFGRILRDYPLAVGAAAIGIGAAVGFLLPETSQESRLMGETRDNLMEQASVVIQDAGEKIQQMVEPSGQPTHLQ